MNVNIPPFLPSFRSIILDSIGLSVLLKYDLSLFYFSNNFPHFLPITSSLFFHLFLLPLRLE